MNFRRLTAAAAFVAVFSVLPAFAQQAGGARPAGGAAQQPARPAAGAASSGAVGDFKIAVINTEAFNDAKTGIGRLVNAVGSVDREFQPRRTELQGLQQNIQKLTEDLNKTTTVQDPKITAQKQEQLDQLKRDLERKQQDAQIAFQKRMGEMLGPIYEDIGKNLEAFAKQRGIGAVIDISKLQSAVYLTNDQMDITSAFIAEYNSRNPATASAATPGR